ncbi:MAG: phospholipase [Tannerella sp.]|jgi:hypothetical protein|nr:phospholipase [Tannerella sp.]
MWYLVSGIIVLGIVAAISGYFDSRRRRPQERGETDTAVLSDCCGRHKVCERDSLLAAAGREAEYYDDEELDAYRGTAPDGYPDRGVEEFREVLYSLRETEVAGWLRSLQLRNINLPEQLTDEALLIVGERRQDAFSPESGDGGLSMRQL